MKEIIVVTFFFFLFLSLNQFIGIGPDDQIYQRMALTRSSISNGASVYQQEYSPLFPTISSFFIHHRIHWKILLLLLFAVITPLLLVKLTGKWYASLFYFSITNYFYYITNSLYSQGLLIIFILAIWSFKKYYLRIPIAIIGLFSHSTAFYVIPFMFALIVFQENLHRIPYKIFLKKLFSFFPASFCSPIWGKNIPEVATTNLTSFGHQANEITINTLGSLFLKKAPLPFLWKSVVSFFEEKQYGFLLVLFLSFFLAFFINNRVFDLLSIMVVIGFTQCWEKIPDKRPWYFLLLVYFIFHFSQFYLIQSKILC